MRQKKKTNCAIFYNARIDETAYRVQRSGYTFIQFRHGFNAPSIDWSQWIYIGEV